MSDRYPLLFHSNAAHSPTGYGQQTALFTPRLNEHYRLGISAFYGVEGNILKHGDIPTYPGIGSTYGNETILSHAGVHFPDGLRSGLVVTLMDVWVLDPMIWRQLNLACWVPIDHDSLEDGLPGAVPPPIEAFFRGSGAVPIAMSRFGERQFQAVGLEPVYCPHAVDCSVYKPHPQDEAREVTKMPKDAFMVGMVAANKGNPSRKCFSEAFQAFKLFHEKHPEARLYLHTEITGKFDGVNLPELMDSIGLSRDVVVFCDQYRVVHYPFAQQTMAQVYSSLDVLLMPSAGEGFGIPSVEAQACGVPVIVSDFSAQPELCGAGWTVSGRKEYTPLKAWQFHPDVMDIADALERAYCLSDGQRKEHSKKAREFAEGYHIDRVLEEYMLPALEVARERFEERAPELVVA